MEEFIERFNGLIAILENIRIPAPQLREIKSNPRFNPQLKPRPFQLFLECFEWYLFLPLIPGGIYGPFYRIDGDHFWPQDSDGISPFSEIKYFYGLKKPANQKEAMEKYKMMPDTPKDYVHEFAIDSKAIGDTRDAAIFLGPVKGGSGYQFNANKSTANIIRSLIIKGKIATEELKKGLIK